MGIKEIFTQEELNEAYLNYDKHKEQNLKVTQTVDDYITVFVDKKSSVITNYMVSSDRPEIMLEGSEEIAYLGKDVPDEALKLISKCEPTEIGIQPLYDFDKEILSSIEIVVEGVNCTYDSETGKWSTNDGSKKYEFLVKVVDDEGDKSPVLKGITFKHQEPGADKIKINNKKSNKIDLKNFKKVTVENLTDEPQTFKVKATILNNDEFWLNKFLNIY